jgi:hypothetical protein
LPAAGETDSKRIAYGMPDVLDTMRNRYSGRTVAVLGAGHSAAGTLLDLVKLASEIPSTKVLWLLRSSNPEKSFGGGANDKLAARGQLGAALGRAVEAGHIEVHKTLQVTDITDTHTGLRIAANSTCGARSVLADELIVATGFRPDLTFLTELRLSLDPVVESTPTLAPLIDPNLHSCGTVRPHGAKELQHPEHGFYIAGIKSYGRAPTFLMVTGYEQVRSIAAAIAGDVEAAKRVELVLPETGVCRLPAKDTGRSCSSKPESKAGSCAA